MLLLARIDAFDVQLRLDGLSGIPWPAGWAKNLASAMLRRGLAPSLAQVNQAPARPWGGPESPSLARP